MKQRRSVTNANRKSFRVDSILETFESKLGKDPLKSRLRQETLQLSFSGFHIAEFATEAEYADVEVFLLRICQKRRKESRVPVMPLNLANLQVPVNPSDSTSSPSLTVEIPADTFAYKNGHVVRSHVLLFKVQCATLREASSSYTCVNGDIAHTVAPKLVELIRECCNDPKALAVVALDRCVAEERKKDLDQQVHVLTTIAKAKSIKQHAIKKAFKRHQSALGGGLRREGNTNSNRGIKQPPTLLLDACMPT
ncbi:polycomb protein suz12-like [Plakobranchus ocellatus]|uniref:Polycomb protein suz12-like n=1 Tax=Plakobranchus ocellatus TaxID=259542 RepID=A0AAV3YFY9_9GAST|nr:polycomb protein suz12-like [Plakobranchus ocellatus]